MPHTAPPDLFVLKWVFVNNPLRWGLCPTQPQDSLGSKPVEETQKVLKKVGAGIGTTGSANLPLLPEIYCEKKRMW